MAESLCLKKKNKPNKMKNDMVKFLTARKLMLVAFPQDLLLYYIIAYTQFAV